MPTIAYLANLFPAASERYVADEIRELRNRGFAVIPCSIRRAAPDIDDDLKPWLTETVYLWPLRPIRILQAAWLCLTHLAVLRTFFRRILFCGKESQGKRPRAPVHTFLGAYYAAVLKEFRPQHIHVHHGYFGSWVAMVAARLLGLDFSMTLHGSDLLLDPAYLDLKLELCQLCVTVSEFNHKYLVANYPQVDPTKIVVQRLGVDCPAKPATVLPGHDSSFFIIFTAGRLHPVKDHAFLIRSCRLLKNHRLKFICLIAGDGLERHALESLIRQLDLQNEIQLLGQIAHARMPEYYEIADLVVLTSRSEGIPLLLMEAMARGKLVLAPNLNGIPELVSDGETGFLYRPGSLDDFVTRVEMIHDKRSHVAGVRQAARQQVLQHFNRQKNLAAFCDRLSATLTAPLPSKYATPQESSYEDSLLQ
jgi:colanic acid/amylovoran biosynthesis glycosyltransferase